MFGDFGKIMKMAGEMKKMQAKLETMVLAGEAGGGAVKAYVNGKGALVDIKFDPAVVKEGDVEMLQDLVKAAVSNAQAAAAKAAAEAMKEASGGLDLGALGGLGGMLS